MTMEKRVKRVRRAKQKSLLKTLLRHFKKNRYFIRNVTIVAIIVFIIVGFYAFSFYLVRTESSPYLRSSDFSKLPNVKVGIVFNPDGEFKPTADLCIQLYKDKKIEKVLIPGLFANRAYFIKIRNYLLKDGVLAADIFHDYMSAGIYDVIYNSRYIYQITSAIILANPSDARRAVYIARQLNINAFGIPSRKEAVYKSTFVEATTCTKDVLWVILDKRPDRGLNLLEEEEEIHPVPISGDGRKTWQDDEEELN
jgi:SanA protein